MVKGTTAVYRVVPVKIVSRLFCRRTSNEGPILNESALLSTTLRARPTRRNFNVRVVTLLRCLFRRVLRKDFVKDRPCKRTILPRLARRMESFHFYHQGTPSTPYLRPFRGNVRRRILQEGCVSHAYATNVSITHRNSIIPIRRPITQRARASNEENATLNLIHRYVVKEDKDTFGTYTITPFTKYNNGLRRSFVRRRQ